MLDLSRLTNVEGLRSNILATQYTCSINGLSIFAIIFILTKEKERGRKKKPPQVLVASSAGCVDGCSTWLLPSAVRLYITEVQKYIMVETWSNIDQVVAALGVMAEYAISHT